MCQSPSELGTSWDPLIYRSTDPSYVRLLLCQAQPTPTRRAASNVETKTASTNVCNLSLWLPSAKLPSAWLPSAWLSASAAHKRTQPYPPAQPAYPPAPTPAAAAAVRRTPAPVPSGYLERRHTQHDLRQDLKSGTGGIKLRVPLRRRVPRRAYYPSQLL